MQYHYKVIHIEIMEAYGDVVTWSSSKKSWYNTQTHILPSLRLCESLSLITSAVSIVTWKYVRAPATSQTHILLKFAGDYTTTTTTTGGCKKHLHGVQIKLVFSWFLLFEMYSYYIIKCICAIPAYVWSYPTYVSSKFGPMGQLSDILINDWGCVGKREKLKKYA